MNLYDVLAGVVPFQQIEATVAAVLASDDVVPRDEHHATVKKEVDWGNQRADQLEAAERRIFKLQRAIDFTTVARIDAVHRLLRDVTGGAGGKHDDTCHHRHAACLARKVREALTQDVTS